MDTQTPPHNHIASGRTLKLARIALGVQVQELARAMNVTSPQISRIENSLRVTPVAEKRYRDALATFATVPTPENGA